MRPTLKAIALVVVAALASVFTCSCATVRTHLPGGLPGAPPISQFAGLSEAMVIAWESYGMDARIPAPPVWVITELTCRNSPGTEMMGFGCQGIEHPGCVCLAGQTLPGITRVALIPGARWDELALCHEYNHTRLGLQTGDSQEGHGAKFPGGPHGPEWDAPLAKCNSALYAKGL